MIKEIVSIKREKYIQLILITSNYVELIANIYVIYGEI